MATIERRKCPFCHSHNLKPGFEVVDNMVSHESFLLMHCLDCKGAFTQNAPDEDSIARYYQSDQYISHSDTKEGLINKVYHKVRSRMLKKKLNWIGKNSEGSTVVDVGAGTGYFVETLQKAGYRPKGFEPDAEARAVAAKRQVRLDPIEALFQLEDGEVDAFTLWHVLEHVHDLERYFSLFYRALNERGTLFLALPNLTSFDARVYKEKWKAWDVPKHLWHFSPQAVEKLAERMGFVVIGKRALPFDPFYISFLSESADSKWYSPFRAAFVSSLSFLKGVFRPSAASSVVYILKKKVVG